MKADLLPSRSMILIVAISAVSAWMVLPVCAGPTSANAQSSAEGLESTARAVGVAVGKIEDELLALRNDPANDKLMLHFLYAQAAHARTLAHSVGAALVWQRETRMTIRPMIQDLVVADLEATGFSAALIGLELEQAPRPTAPRVIQQHKLLLEQVKSLGGLTRAAIDFCRKK